MNEGIFWTLLAAIVAAVVGDALTDARRMLFRQRWRSSALPRPILKYSPFGVTSVKIGPLVGVAAIVIVLIAARATFVMTADEKMASAHSHSASVSEEDQSLNGVSPIDTAGWWPERETISVLSRNSKVVLNSMIDNPVHGDERNFAQIRRADASNDRYEDDLLVQPGEVYVAYFYFKNDARESDTSDAEGVRLQVSAPVKIVGSSTIYGSIASDNAAPAKVQDGFTLVLGSEDEQAALRYVQGSATIHSGGAVNGAPLDEEALFGPNGALLGCDLLDGRLPSLDICGGFVTMQFRVDKPDFVVEAAGRLKSSSDDWTTAVAGKVGDVVELRVSYQNTGTSQQDNVILKVQLPEGVRYLEESTVIRNATTGAEYAAIGDGIISGGLNLGSYQPRGNVFVKFDVIRELSTSSTEAVRIEQLDFARLTTSGGYKDAAMTFLFLR